MEQLKNFKLSHISEKVHLNDNDFDSWLEELGLLHKKRTCNKCGGETTMKVIEGSRYGIWQCTTENCGATQDYLSGTFFEGANLTTKKIFQLSYLWAHQFGKYDLFVHETRIDRTVVVAWVSFFRTVCAEFVKNEIKNDRKEVNADETVRGLLISEKEVWMPGGIERNMQSEKLWRKKFGDASNVFYNFWHHVSLLYPCKILNKI
ncbi:hypothetical protein ACQ4LE_004230 [Meloidogyne hapla]